MVAFPDALGAHQCIPVFGQQQNLRDADLNRCRRGNVFRPLAGVARVDICLNTVDTLERDTGKRPEYISAATPVQVGVAQILLLTENGYTLVRP